MLPIDLYKRWSNLGTLEYKSDRFLQQYNLEIGFSDAQLALVGNLSQDGPWFPPMQKIKEKKDILLLSSLYAMFFLRFIQQIVFR
jgi:hypothetical protein